MEYLWAKALHILSAFLLFGTGLGSAFYKFMADRRGDIPSIAVTNRHVVLADWLFTTPSILIQPLTGLWLAAMAGWPLTTPWLLTSLLLYSIAGVCWLPVAVLQIRMRDLSAAVVKKQETLPALYHRQARAWFWLGVPAFIAMTLTVLLMVLKPD